MMEPSPPRSMLQLWLWLLFAVALVCTILLLGSFGRHTHSGDAEVLRTHAGKLRHLSPDGKFSHLRGFTSDFHIAPIADVAELLRHFGVRIENESLAGSCDRDHTCARYLKVLPGLGVNQIAEDGTRRTARAAFFERYKNDLLIAGRTDFFYTQYLPGMAEMFMPFNKSIIMQVPVRMEVGREDRDSFRELVENVRAIASKPWNRVTANSVYDQRYVEYFTGVNVTYLPNYTGMYVRTDWSQEYGSGDGTRTFLIGDMNECPPKTDSDACVAGEKAHGMQRRLEALLESTESANTSVEPVTVHCARTLCPHMSWRKVAKHSGIIHFPYAPSLMTLFEHYSMNIPMFLPSLDFLCELQETMGVVSNRTWSRTRRLVRARGSLLPRHKNAPKEVPKSDPNNEFDKKGTREWLALCDWYQWPGIIYFDSFGDLCHKLRTADLHAASETMRRANEERLGYILDTWEDILERNVLAHRPEHHPRDPPQGDYDSAMREIYPKLRLSKR